MDLPQTGYAWAVDALVHAVEVYRCTSAWTSRRDRCGQSALRSTPDLSNEEGSLAADAALGYLLLALHGLTPAAHAMASAASC